MKRCKKASLLFILLAVVFVPGLTAVDAAESTLITNATLFLPDGTWQANSFVAINGGKIQKTGRMNQLQPGEIYDNRYDLKGKYLYPAFIDPMYKGFMAEYKLVTPKTDKKKKEEELRPEPTDTFVRPPLAKRNFFVTRSAVKRLKMDKDKTRKIMGYGFGFLNIMPGDGIIGGTTTVVSLVSNENAEAVLVPELFMAVALKPNRDHYPVTPAGIAAQLIQLKADCLYHQKIKKLQFYHPSQRETYKPELDILLPYFSGKKRFMISIYDYSRQRMTERLIHDLGIAPVLVGHPDIWRRPVAPENGIILPLDFVPPERSKYATQGEKLLKEAKEKIYPQKLADFLKKHKTISISPPRVNDHKTFFKNISALIKQGASEADIIDAMTINPAKLLGIDRFAGSIEAGKLAAIAVFDKKFNEKDAAVCMMFLENKVFQFKEPEKETGGDR